MSLETMIQGIILTITQYLLMIPKEDLIIKGLAFIGLWSILQSVLRGLLYSFFAIIGDSITLIAKGYALYKYSKEKSIPFLKVILKKKRT